MSIAHRSSLSFPLLTRLDSDPYGSSTVNWHVRASIFWLGSAVAGALIIEGGDADAFDCIQGDAVHVVLPYLICHL